jgi:hypothetical protein
MWWWKTNTERMLEEIIKKEDSIMATLDEAVKDLQVAFDTIQKAVQAAANEITLLISQLPTGTTEADIAAIESVSQGLSGIAANLMSVIPPAAQG